MFADKSAQATNSKVASMHDAIADLVRDGDTVAIETPAYFGFLEMIESLNLRALEIPTSSREGICLDELRDAIQKLLPGG